MPDRLFVILFLTISKTMHSLCLLLNTSSNISTSHSTNTRVSNIRPSGQNPARQAFLSGPRGLPEMSKMIDLCLSHVFFQAIKYAKTSFLPGLRPWPRWGSLRRSPRPPSRLGRGQTFPIPCPLDAFGISIWPPTRLKFVHFALLSKRLDSPVLTCHAWSRLFYTSVLCKSHFLLTYCVEYLQ